MPNDAHLDARDDSAASLMCPLVLVHGMGGFDEIRIGLRRGKALAWQYFNALPEWLRSHGATDVFCPELPPTGSIRDRARALKDSIDLRYPGARVHLIAHSMGGLDARDYVTRLGGHASVATLAMLGTPHRGSPLATMICSKLIDPAALLAGRWRGKAADFSRVRFASHYDLQPEACEAFNAATPDREEVTYLSWGGAPPANAVQWPLVPFYEILRRLSGAEENDGLVPLESARWSGWQGSVPADHIGFINWQFQAAARRAFDVFDFYGRLLEKLAAAERGEK